MKQKETGVWKTALLYLSRYGFRLSRNQRYKGKIVSGNKITNAWADCGVFGDGGGDLIGYRIITIVTAMAGQQMAQFTMLETKYGKGQATPEQVSKIERVNMDGGIGAFIRNEDDMKKLLDGELNS